LLLVLLLVLQLLLHLLLLQLVLLVLLLLLKIQVKLLLLLLLLVLLLLLLLLLLVLLKLQCQLLRLRRLMVGLMRQQRGDGILGFLGFSGCWCGHCHIRCIHMLNSWRQRPHSCKRFSIEGLINLQLLLCGRRRHKYCSTGTQSCIVQIEIPPDATCQQLLALLGIDVADVILRKAPKDGCQLLGVCNLRVLCFCSLIFCRPRQLQWLRGRGLLVPADHANFS
jgi:hypothetical protein